MATVGRLEASLEQLMAYYTREYGAAAPDRAQWAKLKKRDQDQPVTIVNFFKFTEEVDYGGEGTVTGADAFKRYTDVSIGAVAGVGGEFLMVAPYDGAFIGPEEDWDLVAIATYKTASSVFDLFANKAYKAAYRHRMLACARQKVMLVAS